MEIPTDAPQKPDDTNMTEGSIPMDVAVSSDIVVAPPAPVFLPMPAAPIPQPSISLPPPPPPPPAALALRPAAPAFKSSGKIVKLGDQILKSRPEMKAEFAALETQNDTHKELSVTNRMRLLDAFRLHIPTTEERNRLGIPDSLERLSIHFAYHVMLLCGGSRGVRFSTQDVMEITGITNRLGRIFSTVERTFERMSNNARKLLLNTPANPPKAPEEETPAPDVPIEEIEHIRTFHDQADEYAQNVQQLQTIARRKHAEIASESDVENKDDPVVIDKDPDAAKGATMPEWLTILVRKYVDEYSKGKYGVDSIGRFACFLSVCVSGDILITAPEGRALQTLIQASEDGQTVGWFANLPSPASTTPTTHRRVSSFSMQLPSKPRKYWSKRFFEFMRHLPEMKSIPKGENRLEVWSEFMS